MPATELPFGQHTLHKGGSNDTLDTWVMDGEAYPRVAITATGQVLTGDGTVPPTVDITASVASVAAADGTIIVATGQRGAGITVAVGTVPQANIVNLVSSLAAKAADSAVVHKAGTENITGVKTLGTGVPDPYTGSGATIRGQQADVSQGTDASPVTTAGPTLQVGRVENLLAATGPGTNLTNEKNAALSVHSMGHGTGAAGDNMQVCGVFSFAASDGSAPWDAVGINSVGQVLGSSTRRGTGGYLEGRKDVTGTTLVGAEVRANNESTVNDASDGAYSATGGSNTTGLFVSSSAVGTANPKLGAGVQIYSADGVGKFGVGVGVVHAVDSSFRDDSSSATSILVKGAHTALLDATGATFSGNAVTLPNLAKIGWENAVGNGVITCLYLDSSNRLNFDNSVANPGILISSGTNIQLSTGTGTKLGTAGTQKLGLWGATPIAQPTNATDVRTALINAGVMASGSLGALIATSAPLAAGLVAAGTTNNVSDAGHVHPWGQMQPSDQGLVTWSFDPTSVQGGTILASGILQLAKVRVPATQNITNILGFITVAGSGLTSGQCFAAIYNISGTLLGTTADQSSAWTGTGAQTMAISGGAVSVPAGYAYVALLTNGGTPPTFARGTTNSVPNVGLAAGTQRFGTYGSAQTSIPTITMASIASSAFSLWSALS